MRDRSRIIAQNPGDSAVHHPSQRHVSDWRDLADCGLLNGTLHTFVNGRVHAFETAIDANVIGREMVILGKVEEASGAGYCPLTFDQ